MPNTIPVDGEIRLDSFLKWARATSTGGQSKRYILSGLVLVNGKVETRRGRLLQDKDMVNFDGTEYIVKINR